ncbi:hypothetical protein VTN49DRAFT_1466 [Thermomyces lanuginosus]|uniref:uncharacterized protein n=1 Tax=Thermomyces lanuginosus TaxID=5541 RepID=UPI0037427BE7
MVTVSLGPINLLVDCSPPQRAIITHQSSKPWTHSHVFQFLHGNTSRQPCHPHRRVHPAWEPPSNPDKHTALDPKIKSRRGIPPCAFPSLAENKTKGKKTPDSSVDNPFGKKARNIELRGWNAFFELSVENNSRSIIDPPVRIESSSQEKKAKKQNGRVCRSFRR